MVNGDVVVVLHETPAARSMVRVCRSCKKEDEAVWPDYHVVG